MSHPEFFEPGAEQAQGGTGQVLRLPCASPSQPCATLLALLRETLQHPYRFSARL